MGVSDNEDQFNSEEDLNEDSSESELSDDGLESTDEDGEVVSDVEPEDQNLANQSFTESIQSNEVVLNPKSANALDEEQLEYLKGMPAFQTYVQKLVSEEVWSVTKERGNEKGGKR